MAKTYNIKGIILKRKNYKEADRILTIFTREYGKIMVLAAGVRKLSSKRRGFLEIFNQVKFNLHEGRGFDRVGEVEVNDMFSSSVLELSKISRVYYLAETIDKLVAERVPEGEIYDILENFLFFCRKNCNIKDLDLRLFSDLKKILIRLGFASPQNMNQNFQIGDFIEQVAEKKLKSRKILKK